jgi:membrane protease YdiL (CAAX protease family)
MKNRTFLAILPVLFWFGLLFILWLVSSSKGFTYYVLASLSLAYEFAVPLVIVKTVEKQNLTGRFGLQSWRKGTLLYLVFMSVLSIQSSVGIKWESLLPVLFAPVVEEFFFRGFFLSSFRNKTAYQNPEKFLVSVLLSSVAFSFSHVFAAYNLIDYLIAFCLGLLYGFVYVFSGSIVYPVSLHIVFNFIQVSRNLAISQTYLWVWILLFLLPFVFRVIGLLRHRTKHSDNSRQIGSVDTPKIPDTSGFIGLSQKQTVLWSCGKAIAELPLVILER